MKGMDKRFLVVVFISAAMLAAILTFITTNQKTTTAIGADDYCLYIPKDIEERVASLNRLADEQLLEIERSYKELTNFLNDKVNRVTFGEALTGSFPNLGEANELIVKITEQEEILIQMSKAKVEVMGDLTEDYKIAKLIKMELLIAESDMNLARLNTVVDTTENIIKVLKEYKGKLESGLKNAITKQQEILGSTLAMPILEKRIAEYEKLLGIRKKALEAELLKLKTSTNQFNRYMKISRIHGCDMKALRNLFRGSVYSIIGSICLSLTVDELFASPPPLTEEQTTPPSITPPPTDKPLPDLSE